MAHQEAGEVHDHQRTLQQYHQHQDDPVSSQVGDLPSYRFLGRKMGLVEVHLPALLPHCLCCCYFLEDLEAVYNSAVVGLAVVVGASYLVVDQYQPGIVSLPLGSSHWLLG